MVVVAMIIPFDDHKPLDFIGWNCYLSSNFNDGPDGKPYRPCTGIARTAMGWPVTPDALYWGVRFIYDRYYDSKNEM